MSEMTTEKFETYAKMPANRDGSLKREVLLLIRQKNFPCLHFKNKVSSLADSA